MPNGLTKTTTSLVFLIKIKSLSNILRKKACSAGAKNVWCVEKQKIFKYSKINFQNHTSGMSLKQKTYTENWFSAFNMFKMTHRTFLTQNFFRVICIFHIVCNSTKNRKLMLIKKLFTFWTKFFPYTLPSMMSSSSQIFRISLALQGELKQGGFSNFTSCKWWHVLYQNFLLALKFLPWQNFEMHIYNIFVAFK